MSELTQLRRSLRQLRNELRRDPRVKFLDVRLVGVFGPTIELQTLVVRADRRTGGAGSEVMAALTAFADQHGLGMILTPSDAYGGDEARLRQFYARWGFAPVDEIRMGRAPVRRNPPSTDARLAAAERRWLSSGSIEDKIAYRRELTRVGRTWPDDLVIAPGQAFSQIHRQWSDVPPAGRTISVFLGHAGYEHGRLVVPIIAWTHTPEGFVDGVREEADEWTIEHREGDWWAGQQAQRILRQQALAPADPRS